MGQKDLAAKELESKPDVFADIINAFVYDGESVVQPKHLKPAPTETVYERTHKMLHNQYNDVSKHEMAGQKIRMQYVLENESTKNYRLILRKAGYEGAVYRSQYEEKHVYPVIILVLYWGEKKWKPRADLHEFFGKENISEPVGQYIDNIKLHLFSMAHLPQDIRKRFKSDLRIIVDYLAEGNDYEPTNQKIKYVEPVMRLLYALTGEWEFISSIGELTEKQEKGDDVTMCEVVDKFVARGLQQGLQQGRERAILELLEELGNVPRRIVERIRTEDNPDVLSRWHKAAAKSGSIAEFETNM